MPRPGLCPGGSDEGFVAETLHATSVFHTIDARSFFEAEVKPKADSRLISELYLERKQS